MKDRNDLTIVDIGLEELRAVWGWYLGLGIALVLLGVLAIANSLTATMAIILFLGWILLTGGILQVIFAFWRRRWGGFFVEMITGFFYIMVAVLMIENPGQTAEVLTAILALLMMIVGLFRIGIAVTSRLPQWIWLALSGVVSLVLGVMIWRHLAESTWLLGCFLGLELIFGGWPLIMLGLFARKLSQTGVAPPSETT